LHTKDFIAAPPYPFIIERYTLPFRFIELQKQINIEGDKRDKHLKWIVHSDTDVFETIDPKNDVLKDFEHFRKSSKFESGVRISRVLQKPLTFRQSVCQVSVFVWINNMNPFEIFIFSEPFLTLLNEPEILGIRSVFDGKYSYKQVIGGLKKDLGRPRLMQEVWSNLCKNTAYAIVVMLPRLTKNNNSMHLLEFKYMLEAETIKPWLFNINSDVKFQSLANENPDDVITENSPTQKSKYVAQYKGKYTVKNIFRQYDVMSAA
jgi:hypothetical protein